MEYRQMKYFLTVVDCGSISAAAQQLYISQPALSAFIKKVEKSLGLELFDRSTTPITLTYAGQRYIKAAERIVRIYERMLGQLKDIAQGETGRLRVGMTPELYAYLAPTLTRRAAEQMPTAELSEQVADERTLVEWLRMNRIDTAIMSLTGPIQTFNCVELRREAIIAVAAEGYFSKNGCLDSGSGLVKLQELADIPLLVLPRDGLFKKLTETLLDQEGIAPSNLIECPTQAGKLRMAAAGCGVALVPEHMLELISTGAPVDRYRTDSSAVTSAIYAVFGDDVYIGRLARGYLQHVECCLSELKA